MACWQACVTERLLAVADKAKSVSVCMCGVCWKAWLTQQADLGVAAATGSQQCIASFAAHSGPVTAVAAVPHTHESLLVTGGKDHMVRLWQVAEEQATASSSSSTSLVAVYAGHKDAVEAVAVSPSGDRLCSTGWDGAVYLWQTGMYESGHEYSTLR